MKLDLKEFAAEIICEEDKSDCLFETDSGESSFDIYLTAQNSRPKYIKLRWNFNANSETLVLGDAWERSYGNLEFIKIGENKRYMPWYFVATDKVESLCFGVKTGCNSFVSFRCENGYVEALVDVRNGGSGVHLNGRKVHLATFVLAQYSGDVLEGIKDFCKKLCPDPVLPDCRIYGGNNWYYAYGKSNFKQIVSDARLMAELSEGISNPPFEVIDDCWQKHRCEGPWLPNRKFKDMKSLASEIKALGVRPGIWFRPLHNRSRVIKKEMRILRKGRRRYLDPTHPAVQQFLREDIERIKSWGFELIKHDFTTADLFGDFGGSLDATITRIDGWHFYDKTKTNAEIVLDLYRLIKEAAGDMLIIGCNTVSHLSAGLVQIYRTGDDTSGREWERTKKMGVNTLAFRLAQNEAFYMCDADCVGIIQNKIPWEKNRMWLHLLSKSNTPLFISCNDTITSQQKADLKEAFKTFNEKHEFKPLDIYSGRIPSEWFIDGEKTTYKW